MHRNTFLLASFLAVVAALLVGFNIGRRFQPSGPAPTPSVAVTPSPAVNTTPRLLTYTSAACGVSVQFPETLTTLEATSGAMFVDSRVASNSVMLTCQKEIPRPPLLPEKIETLALEASGGATISAKLYHDVSAKGGTPIDKLIFVNPKTGLDTLLAGFGSAFQQILSSLKIL